MKLRSVMTVLVLGACAPSFAADAVTVILSDFKYGGSQQATITNNNTVLGTYRAGEYKGTIYEQGSIVGQSFSTFCTDVYQPLNFGPVYQYDRKTVDQTKELWGNDPYAVTIYNPNSYSLVSKLYTTAYTSVNNSTTSTAFQYALWELLYEKDTTIPYTVGNTGNFRLTGTDTDATSQANTWLASLSNASEGYSIQSLYSGAQQNPAGRQDLVIATPVPEPQTYALALVSLGIVAGYARRKRDKA